MTVATPKKAPISLTRYAWLSIVAALVTIALKSGAYWLTGSVGLFSDALESAVNLVAAGAVLWALRLSALPADHDHNFGHDKAEYFSSGLEGGLIIAAAIAILQASIPRLSDPSPIESVGAGVLLSLGAALVNGAVSWVLFRAARVNHSLPLAADAQHLLTDVITSVGVLVAIVLVSWTHLYWLDPLIAIGVAVSILLTGVRLVRRSLAGLMDVALPVDEIASIEAVLTRYQQQGIDWHALRTRQAGARRFVSVHILVPGDWTVQAGHDLLEQLEYEVYQALPHASLSTHLEPINDPRSFVDQDIDRSVF
ncbi:MAG: cation diffusion facilitator family transporter [Phototrophicaceae bacterium]